ncbi:MAG: VapE domain-containing protein [Bacteroidia bacterium]
MQVSVVKNFNEVTENISINDFLDQVKNGKFKTEIDYLRLLSTSGQEAEYKKLKKKLLAITPSATFNANRSLDNLAVYSQLLVLDIDSITPEQLHATRSIIIDTPTTYACFISPSNNGLKIFVKVDNKPGFHKQAFEEVKEYYEKLLNIKIDPSGKDIPRLCFYSYDPVLFVNSYSEIYKTHINMIDQDIENVVLKIESNQTDIANDYNYWVKIGFTLVDALNEGGREYFHRISKISAKYNKSDCDLQYDTCLKYKRSGVTIKTFFYIAREYGVDISSVKSCVVPDYKPAVREKSQRKAENNEEKIVINKIENYLKTKNYDFRFNDVTSRTEVKLPAKYEFVPITDYIENSIFRDILKSGIKCNLTLLHAVIESNFSKRYDPFMQYFDKLPAWDATTDYIKELAALVKTTNDELWFECFRKWIVAMVASLIKPDIVNQVVIVLTGSQGIGKTTWCLNIIPPCLRNYTYSGSINPNNKDTLIHLSECMLINLDELENLNRSEIGSLKEVITKSTIRSRKAYGRNNENFTRRASFIGSVNTAQFLNDSTGSRRFLCFESLDIIQDFQLNYDQLYAQALSLFKNGFRYWFDKSEIEVITANNEQYQLKTMEEELLLTYFKKPSISDNTLYLTATQILYKFASHANFSAGNANVINLGKLLKKHGFEKKKKNSVYAWVVAECSDMEIENDMRNNPEQVDNENTSFPEDQKEDDSVPY